MPISLPLELLLMLMVVAAACTDLLSRRIPNNLLLLCGLAAIGLHLAGPAPGADLLRATAGFFTGLAVFLPLYCLKGMAAGDVKLMAATGLFMAPQQVLWLAVLTVCAGGVMGIAVVIWKGRWRDALTNVLSLLRPLWMGLVGMRLAAEPLPKQSVGNLPYGLAIASATLYLLLTQHG